MEQKVKEDTRKWNEKKKEIILYKGITALYRRQKGKHDINIFIYIYTFSNTRNSHTTFLDNPDLKTLRVNDRFQILGTKEIRKASGGEIGENR